MTFFMVLLKLRSILNGVFKKHAVYCIIRHAARLRFHKYQFGPRAFSTAFDRAYLLVVRAREEGNPNVLKDSCTNMRPLSGRFKILGISLFLSLSGS